MHSFDNERNSRHNIKHIVSTWIMAALRDVGYIAAVGVWAVAAFAIVVTGVSVTASLLVLAIGAFVWLGFAYVLRWTTYVDRRLAAWQRGEGVPAAYRRPATRGVVPMLKTISADPQTWKDLAWLCLTSILGFAMGTLVITTAGVALTYLSMPLWYWAISDPATHDGITNLGRFTVDTPGQALAASAIGLVLVPITLALARWFATAHAGLAVRMLSPSRGAEFGAP